MYFLFFRRGEDVLGECSWWGKLKLENGTVKPNAYQTAPNEYNYWLEYKDKASKIEYEEILDSVNMTIYFLENVRRIE